MSKFLSRQDVDKLLDKKTEERILTSEEISKLRFEVQKLAKSRGLGVDEISQFEIQMILKELGLDKVKIYTESEIKGEKK